MGYSHSNATRQCSQHLRRNPLDAKAILDSVDASALLDRLWQYRWNGRPGYPLKALWRAHLLRFLLNLPSINALIRRLQEDSRLRRICGFGPHLPHRTTFNRFFARVSLHQDLVEQALAGLTNQLRGVLPGFGRKIAIDSTNIPTYANPHRKSGGDPEAGWTAKAYGGRKEVEWHYGYKYHCLVDADYGIPISGYTTAANRSDMLELTPLLDKASRIHNWFAPEYVMADKGYDSSANHRAVLDRGIIPIIPIRSLPKGRSREGVFSAETATPTCIGNLPMDLIRSDLEKGHLFRCQPEGCHLKNKRGVRYCDDEFWESAQVNPRVLGPVSRDSEQWKVLYGLRQSVERVFKSLKQSRALSSHCVRGLLKVGLHASMSVLALQATVLMQLRRGLVSRLRWQVPKVA